MFIFFRFVRIIIYRKRPEHCLPFSLGICGQFSEIANSFRYNFTVQTDYDPPGRLITNFHIEKDLNKTNRKMNKQINKQKNKQ